MADALALAAQQAGISTEELRGLLDRDAVAAAAHAAAKRQRVDGGSCSSDLPPGWVEAKDPRYNNATYWYNRTTRTTSWTRPVGGPPQALSGGQRGGYALQPSGYGQGGYGQGGYGHGQPPPGGGGGGYGGVPPQSGAAIEAKLDAWVAAKRGRDFQRADDLRSELRAAGS